MAVLQNSELKNTLRNNGIEVAADLTKRQRAELEHVKKEGKFSYSKNGRLYNE